MAALCYWHEDIELFIPLKGYMNHGITKTVKEGNMIVASARHMHCGFSADGTDCEHVCVTFCRALKQYRKSGE